MRPLNPTTGDDANEYKHVRLLHPTTGKPRILSHEHPRVISCHHGQAVSTYILLLYHGGESYERIQTRLTEGKPRTHINTCVPCPYHGGSRKHNTHLYLRPAPQAKARTCTYKCVVSPSHGAGATGAYIFTQASLCLITEKAVCAYTHSSSPRSTGDAANSYKHMHLLPSPLGEATNAFT